MSSLTVVKVGGAPIDAINDASPFWDALARACAASPSRFVIAHGGGSIVDARLAALGVKPTRVDGLRVTPPAHIEEVVASLAGVANTRVVAALQSRRVRAVGMRATDAGLTRAVAADPGKRLGCVADAVPGEADAVRALLESGATPVISSIGVDGAGAMVNINADVAAAAVACALNAKTLILITSTRGVLTSHGATMDQLDDTALRAGVATGAITAGMIPKIESALACAASAGCAVRIASWRDAAAHERFDWRTLPGTRIDPPRAASCAPFARAATHAEASS